MMIRGEGATRGLVGWATRGGGTDPGVLMTPMTPEVSAYLSLPASLAPKSANGLMRNSQPLRPVSSSLPQTTKLSTLGCSR